MKELAKFIDNKFEWSKRTFGLGDRTVGIIEHIKKELDEVLADPKDLEEWVDVILLAFDGACRAGYNGEDIACAILSKQMKNLQRKWPADGHLSPDLPIEHVRE